VLRPLPRVLGHALGRDGSASWKGEAFTTRLGSYRGDVFEEDFENLTALIERLGFFDWADRYAEEVTDNPEYVLEVVRQGGLNRWCSTRPTSHRISGPSPR
jgi:hypothetical protein